VKTVDIVYRYEASDTSARPLPKDSSAALLRLNGGNSDFAALLDHVNDESGIQRIIPVDPRDLGFGSDVAGTPEQRPFAAVLGCMPAFQSNSFSTRDQTIFSLSAWQATASAWRYLAV
jgi:carbonic anhydrase